ncbi:MAG: hypothetical protein AAB384_02830 [Patescibacteria group bacterium]
MQTKKSLESKTRAIPKLNAIVILQMNREVADGSDAVVDAKGFDDLVSKYTADNKNWVVLYEVNQNIRLSRTLDPCIAPLQSRGSMVMTQTIARFSSDEAQISTAIQQIQRAALSAHVLICTRCVIRERLVAVILEQLYGMKTPPRFAATQAHTNGGSADVLTPATLEIYERATAGKRSSSDPDPSQRVVVRLIGT